MSLGCIWMKGKHGEPMEPILVGRSHLGENDTLRAQRTWRTWHEHSNVARICLTKGETVSIRLFSRSVFRFGRREGGLVECSARGKLRLFFFFLTIKLHPNSMEKARSGPKMKEYGI